MFILVLAFINFKSGENIVEGRLIADNYIKSLTLVIIILSMFSIYFFNVKTILVSRNLIQALSAHEEGLSKNLEFYQRALAYDYYGGNQEIREQLLSNTSLVLRTDASAEIKEGFLILSREEMQKQIDLKPTSVRHQIFMASFLNRLKLYEEAEPYLEEALRLSPKRQQTLFELITNNLNSGQLDKAEEFAKRTFELDQRFNIARIIYATTLIYNNKIIDADNLLKEKFNEDFGDERIARAYYTVGDLDRAIEQWGNVINNQPGNIQFRMALAATLLEAGRRDEAVDVLIEAIKVIPEFKKQGEFFIREIQAGRNP